MSDYLVTGGEVFFSSLTAVDGIPPVGKVPHGSWEKSRGSREEVSKSRSNDSFASVLARVKSHRAATVVRPQEKRAPYSNLAENGVIHYNGVTFACDNERRTISLGDVSDPRKCIRVPLEGGGSLVVIRDSLSSLAKAIGMFSPEDVRRILSAIKRDEICQEKLQEIENLRLDQEALK